MRGLADIKFDDRGLVPAIVQEEGTNQVLMLAWMNRDALQRTLETGRTWFWSRSRREFWCKGETSGDRQYVRACYYDCDMDVLLCIVEQEGRGACCRSGMRASAVHCPTRVVEKSYRLAPNTPHARVARTKSWVCLRLDLSAMPPIGCTATFGAPVFCRMSVTLRAV